MPKNPLFSTYRQGENRVTASMLAVFERIGLDVLEQLLAGASGESSISFVSFENQLGGPEAVPDASIRANLHHLFEVKIARGALRTKQLRGHLARFEPRATDQRLFVITPDADEPSEIGQIGDKRILWFSFRDLSETIDAVLSDPRQLVSDQERFLLHELQALFETEGLISSDDVVVVAAKVAYPEYLEYSAYVCQQDRSFRSGVERMAFYTQKQIKPEIPRILAQEPDVPFTLERAHDFEVSGSEADLTMAALIRRQLSDGFRAEGERVKIVLLSPAGTEPTLVLDGPVRHETPGAWTQWQRYTRSELLRAAQTTGDLVQA